MASAPVASAPSATLTSKSTVSVKGDLQPSGLATFKKKVSGTTFSFQVTDQTLRDPSSYNGYTVSASRTDGKLATTLSHDFGKDVPKVRLVGTQKSGSNTYVLDYTHWPKKSGAGSVEATVKLGKEHKVALGHKLESGLSQLTYTLDKGDYAASAAVDSKFGTGVTATKREGAYSTKLGLHVAGSKTTAELEWQRKPYKVTAKAPVTSEGLGTAHLSLIWEKTFDL